MLEDDFVLCSKRGLVTPNKKCRKFAYDPLRRIPTKPKTLDFNNYNEEDYSL